ncbi:AAA family ATPase [Streptomyces sp. NPDC001068]|uniref:helix-turn-helix transcriptional regulator n=1 Tax=Streptomyces sp. NPDC001068 TaxID=3364544 RepID=UPI00367CFE08
MRAPIGPTGSYEADSDDTALVGREYEKKLVTELLGGLPRSGGVLRVHGAAGTGKSTIVRFAAIAAGRRGIRVLATAWAPAERALPHAALHGLLRPELTRLNCLPAADRLVLDTAFGGGPNAPDPADLATATLRLLATAPEPVLLCVDDIDRLDAVSRDTLNALARLCADSKVSMIIAERAEPRPRTTVPDTATTTLDGLPGLQARAILNRAGRTTGYTEEQLVLAVADGNPLALTELSLGVGHLGDAAGFGMLPATARLAEAHADDLKGLSAQARDVLLVAALSAAPRAHDILAASALLLGGDHAARAGLSETTSRGLLTEVTEATEALEYAEAEAAVAGAAGVAGQKGGLLRFPRPLLRPAVLFLESAARRMAAHAVLGQTLSSPPHAAWHAARCAAGPDEELALRLESLADGPHLGTGVLVGLAALEEAARLSPDPERRAGRLLRAAELACDHGLVEQALRHARRIDPAELGTYGRALLLWVHDLLPGNSVVGRERIAELCEAAHAVAGQDPVLTRKLLHAAARRCWWQQAGRDERRMVREAFEDLRSGPRDARDLAVMALTDPLSSPWPADPHPDSALPGGDEAALLGQVAHLSTDLDRAAPFFEEAERAVRAEGRYGRLPQILVPRAMGQIWLGTQWHTARALAEEGRTIADRTGQPDWVARATATLGVVDALQGRTEHALERAAEVEEASLRLGQNRQLGLAALARAITASGTGRYAQAYARLRSLFTEPAVSYAHEEFWGLAFLAEAAQPAGETDDAKAVVAHVAALTETGRAPLAARILAYAEAVLASDQDAEVRYRRALEPGAEVWPLLHAMTQFGYGAWLRRRRRITASRQPLITAESVFRGLGALSRAEQAASELRATGQSVAGRPAEDEEQPVTDDLSQALSPQQLTIARLAARGLTNRAIGEQLRLSPRTVASHLYQIFPKLDVTSRAELAARFGTD